MNGGGTKFRMKFANSCSGFVLLFLILCYANCSTSADDDSIHYMIVAVSGGLQTGFPDHTKLHYYRGGGDPNDVDNDTTTNEQVVKAIFVGRALVRGCKAYLDVMQPGWRQYTPEPEQPLINSVVMVSGCYEHANQYWVYLVDQRQVLSILNNEPRFLSITPDAVLVDLTSNETDDAVKYLANNEIQRHRHYQHTSHHGGGLMPSSSSETQTSLEDSTMVALPTVVAVHYHDSFVPSPPVRVHTDGTKVTNFPESLARWANVHDSDRMAGMCRETPTDDARPCETVSDNKNESQRNATAMAHQQRYWDGIRRAIRMAETHPLDRNEWKQNGPPYQCQQDVRLGTSPFQLRINYPFTSKRLVKLFEAGGYRLDLNAARLERNTPRCSEDVSIS